MSWDTSLLKTVRYTIGDFTTPYRFSDYEILQAILVATKFVQADVALPYTYTVVLGSGGYITPDPSLSNGCSQDAQVLIALRAAAILADVDARKMAARDGARASLGPSLIDANHGPAIRVLLKDGPMGSYKKASWEYNLSKNIAAYRVILSPARMAWADSQSQYTSEGCPEYPQGPCITFADNGNGSGVTATVGCSSDGSSNTVEVSGSWIPVGSRTSNGTIIFYSGVGNYYGRVVSRLNGASGISPVVAFTILPVTPSLSFSNYLDGESGSYNVTGSTPSMLNTIQYATSLAGSYNFLASGLADFSGTFALDSGIYYGRVVTSNNGVSVTGTPLSFTISLPAPTGDGTNLNNGSGISVIVTGGNSLATNVIQYATHGGDTWTDAYSGTGPYIQTINLTPVRTYDIRIKSSLNGTTTYSNTDVVTITFATPSIAVNDALNGSGAYYFVTGSNSLATNTVQTRLNNSVTWVPQVSGVGNISGTMNLTPSGIYNARVKSELNGGTTFSTTINFYVSDGSASGETPPPSLPNMPNSNINMRATTNAAHPFWDIDLYTEYDEPASDAMMVLGTRVNFGLTAERTRCSASGDVYEGLATSTELSNGLKHVWVRYGELWSGYKVLHPDTFVGSYQASFNLKTNEWMLNTGVNYPTDTDKLSPYQPGCTGEGDPIAAPGAVASIDILDPTCLELSSDRFVEMAAGTLRNHFKEDGIWFDEVGYTSTYWDTQVDRFTDLKTRFHAEGVRLGINLGGTNLTAPFGFGPNIFSELPQMCDFMTHEGPWPRTAGADGLSTRTQDNTERLISNYRGLMDSGVSLIFVPTSNAQDNNIHTISTITETDGGTRLLVTFSSPAYIFPHGGYAVEKMILDGLQATYAGLENYAWTPEEVIGNPSQVKLYYRFASLSSIKSTLGIAGSISNVGGTLEDYQASVRMAAGLAMMIRRSDDPIFVSQGPSPNSSLAGSGNPLSIDCWWYWPNQFGSPITDPIIDTTGAGGIVTQMHRDFDNGTITVYPSGGYVVATLN